MEEVEVGAVAPSESVQEAVSTEVTTQSTTSDPFEDTSVETFDRNYVENLRKENAKYRTRAQKFEQAFDGLPEGVDEGFLGLAQAYKNDPQAAREVLSTLLDGLTPEEQEALIESIEEETASEDPRKKPLTLEDLERIQQEREVEDKTQAALAEINKEITGFGYDLETPNPDTTLFFHFVQAQEGEGPKDFKKAHEAVEAFKQAAFEATKTKIQQDNSVYPHNAAVTGGVPGGLGGTAEKRRVTDGGARRSMEARLEAALDQ